MKVFVSLIGYVMNVFLHPKKVLDKSMPASVPCTSKTGGLLYLSFVKRKPETLGTKFKIVAGYGTGILLHLEVMVLG